MKDLEINTKDLLYVQLLIEENINILEKTEYYQEIIKRNQKIMNKVPELYDNFKLIVYDEFINSINEINRCEMYFAYLLGVEEGKNKRI